MHLPIRIHIARSSSKSAAPPGRADERARTTLSADERLFALGTRTLADLIAPAGVEVRRDHLQLDAQYVRALAVTGQTTSAGIQLRFKVAHVIRSLASHVGLRERTVDPASTRQPARA